MATPIVGRATTHRTHYYLDEKPLVSVRLEKLKDAWLRVVFIGPEGGPVDERLLPPV